MCGPRGKQRFVVCNTSSKSFRHSECKCPKAMATSSLRNSAGPLSQFTSSFCARGSLPGRSQLRFPERTEDLGRTGLPERAAGCRAQASALMRQRPFIVAIDGPAGAGKSTVSKILARRLQFSLVDTGAIYRCVALLALRGGIALDDDAKLGDLLNRLTISFEFAGEEIRVMLGSEDVSAAIRTPEVSMAASKVSSRPAVRKGLLALQRRLDTSDAAIDTSGVRIAAD